MHAICSIAFLTFIDDWTDYWCYVAKLALANEKKLTCLDTSQACVSARVVLTIASCMYSQDRLISPRLIEHSRNITNFLGTGRPH